MQLLITQNFVIFALLPSCRTRTPPYVSFYCRFVGFKHHCMSPFTVSFSCSNTNACLLLLSFCRFSPPLYVSHYCLTVGFQHHRMSPISVCRVPTPLYVSPLLCLSVEFQHHCMSPFTVYLSG